MARETAMPGRVLPLLAAIVALALVIGLVAALASGDLAAEGRRIADLAWGRLLLIDVYAGMALFAAWIAWRERVVAAIAWIAALLAIGNLVACIYLATAWVRAGGDGARFWHGRRATNARASR